MGVRQSLVTTTETAAIIWFQLYVLVSSIQPCAAKTRQFLNVNCLFIYLFLCDCAHQDFKVTNLLSPST